MDTTLSQILHACRLARELEASLEALVNHPPILRSSCEDIVRVFSNAVHELNDQQQHMLFRDQVHGLQAIDLLGQNPMSEEAEISLVGFDAGGAGGDEQPATSVKGSTSSGSSARRHSTGSIGQRASRKRKEGCGMKTIRVPAVRTGNMENPPDDGYTWRKYGQKDILGSRFSRSYYRCTHKNFYGCEAKKQVQRLDQDPYTYEVTYCGDHTCQTSTTPLLFPPSGAGAVAPTHPSSGPQHADVAMQILDSTTSAQSSSSSSLSQLLSTSIQLGSSSWFNVGSQSDAAAAHAGPTDGSVADLADVMFNSGSSGSSMDAIFSLRHEGSTWKDKEDED